MNKNFKRIGLYFGIFCTMALFAILLLHFTIPKKNENSKKIPLQNPLKIYESAISGINSDAVSYDVVLQKASTIDEERFSENRTQSITTIKQEAQDILFAVEETLKIGDHSTSISEIYQNDTVYITLEDSNFVASANTEEYVSRYAPLILISPNNYATITGYTEDEKSYITFLDPKMQEQWLWDKNLEFETAEGNVVISKDGGLLSSAYHVTYLHESVKITLTITTRPKAHLSSIKIPDDLTSYTEINTPEAPKLLEIACGYLTQATSISATYEDYIECTAFEDRQNRRIQIDAINDQDWASLTRTTLTYLDHSKAGSDTVIEKEEIFSDGKYYICIDNTDPIFKDSVTQENIRSECLNTIVGTIMLPEQIADAEISESDTTYDIIYTANSLFSEQMRANACETLYQNPDILSDQTDSYTVNKSICYLRLDKATGLPIASGFRYIGTYTIDALPYQLEFRADQQYYILNDDAINKIQSATQS